MYTLAYYITISTYYVSYIFFFIFDDYFNTVYNSSLYVYYVYNTIEWWHYLNYFVYIDDFPLNDSVSNSNVIDEDFEEDMLNFLLNYNLVNDLSIYNIYAYSIYNYLDKFNFLINIFNHIVVIVSIIFIVVLMISIFLKDIVLKNFVLNYFIISNEIESNLISIIDFFYLFISFFFIFKFINFSINSFINLNALLFFFLFFIINIISIFSYLNVFNINVFIFLSGLQFKLNLLKWFIFDTSNLIVFVLRILLQYIRLILCSIFFILLQELFDFFKLNNLFLNIYNFSDYFLNKFNNFFIRFSQIIVELLDTTTNISMQITIFIVVVMWLMPFLFSNIKKKNKFIKIY